LGIPADLREACTAILHGFIARIDLLSVNGICFATNGGLGLGAAIAIRANRWRDSERGARHWQCLLGRRVYALAAMAELARGWQPFRARLGTPARLSSALCASLLISNQPDLGGFRPSPAACNRDGFLDLCAIRAPARAGRMAWISLQVLRGRTDLCREVDQYRARELRIATDRPLPFFGDGEVLCRSRHFLISVRHRALRVAVPCAAVMHPREETGGARHD
jgi:diacylglycerol kinase family enzyme